MSPAVEQRAGYFGWDLGHALVAGVVGGGVEIQRGGYGPSLRALAVYLLVYRHVPVARTAQLIADLTGASPSPV